MLERNRSIGISRSVMRRIVVLIYGVVYSITIGRYKDRFTIIMSGSVSDSDELPIANNSDQYTKTVTICDTAIWSVLHQQAN